MNKPTQEQIEFAKNLLRQAGYYVDNMWTIHDVLGMYETSNETAMDLLDGAMRNESVIEHIFDALRHEAESEGIQALESENN